MKVVIAGASGFIGHELMTQLPGSIGLSRGYPKSDRFIQVDLFSRTATEKALQNCDVAIYLVHSMLPTSHLDQGNFEDFDLLIADNFVRACAINDVKQIIYLGGIIPNNADLSPHLKSRKEVEKILKSTHIPVTILRSGLIIGAKGSSFNILKNLANKLPVMICPNWLSNKMEPVSLSQVIESIKYCLNNPERFNKTYDIGMGQQFSYSDIIKLARKVQKKDTFQINAKLPMFLVKFLMKMISGAPKNLILPLVESLRHSMLPREDHRLIVPGFKSETMEFLLKRELTKNRKPHAFSVIPDNREVRSIQRINVYMPPEVKVYQIYFHWINHFLPPFLKVMTNGEICVFKFLGFRLLVLQNLKNESNENHEILSITGGILSSKNQSLRYGRLEFRKFDDCVVVAIHEYVPSLPWPIYIYTQAIFHAFVMNKFSHFLTNQKEKEKVIPSLLEK